MAYKKILIIALSGAGDVLMATPLIHELKLNFPKSKIDVLVMQGEITKDILNKNKDISRVIYFNFLKEGVIKSLMFCNMLRKEKYSLSINVYPQARLHYSIISYLIHAKKRIGFSYKTQKLKLNRLFFHNVIEEDFEKHVIENNLEVLKVFEIFKKTKNPKMIFNLNLENKKFADDFFRKKEIKKAIIIHPGSGVTKNFIKKRWEKDNFAKLAKTIWQNKRIPIILIGGKDEEGLLRDIAKKSGLKEDKEIFVLIENIRNISAVIKKSLLVIVNDTIIGHISAALGVNVIGIFGPTSWENTGPYTKKRIIICKRSKEVGPYIHGRKGITEKQAESLKLIGVEEVYEAVKKMIK